MKGIYIKRKLMKLSQQSLGEKISVKQNTISNWERGTRTPNARKLKQLSEVLKCQIEELF